MVWCDVMWYSMVWCGIVGVVWYSMVWYSMVWCGIVCIWYSVVWVYIVYLRVSMLSCQALPSNDRTLGTMEYVLVDFFLIWFYSSSIKSILSSKVEKAELIPLLLTTTAKDRLY